MTLVSVLSDKICEFKVTCFDIHCISSCWSTNWSFQRSQFVVVLSLLHPSVSGILCLSCGQRFRGSLGCQFAAVADGRLGWRQQTDADCCTSAFSWEGAGAWLQLYGLLLYSCLRTGAATCSCMPIRQAHLTHPAAAGSMPTVFNTSTPQCQLTSVPLELLFLLWSFRCPAHNTSTAGRHCWCVTWLSGVRTHSYRICRSRMAGLHTCLFLTLIQFLLCVSLCNISQAGTLKCYFLCRDLCRCYLHNSSCVLFFIIRHPFIVSSNRL